MSNDLSINKNTGTVLKPSAEDEIKSFEALLNQYNLAPVATIYCDPSGEYVCVLRDAKCPEKVKDSLDLAFPNKWDSKDA